VGVNRRSERKRREASNSGRAEGGSQKNYFLKGRFKGGLAGQLESQALRAPDQYREQGGGG